MSYAFLQYPWSGLDLADELESFFWMFSVFAIGHLRTELTVPEVVKFLEDVLSDLTNREWRQRMLLAAKMVTPLPVVFKGRKSRDDSIVDSPLNVFFQEYLHLLHAECRDTVFHTLGDLYTPPARAFPRPGPTGDPKEENKENENGASAPEPPPDEKVSAREIAKQLQNHDAVLKLAEEVLAMEWPREESDYVGDQRRMGNWETYKKLAADWNNIALAARKALAKERAPQVEAQPVAGKNKDQQQNEAAPSTTRKRPARGAAARKSRAPKPKKPTARAGQKTKRARQQEEREPVVIRIPAKRQNPVRQCRDPKPLADAQEPPAKRRRRC